MAAINDHPQVAKRLLVAGAHASAADSNLMTPLHLAAQRGHDSVIEELLNARANIDVLDRNKYSALHWAAVNQHISTATKLLEAGISAQNRRDGIGIAKYHSHFNIADAISKSSPELAV
jgi:ankyrin repeat protein